SLKDYKTGSSYSVYEIPGLIRLIGKRVDLFTKGLQQQLAENSKQLPIVLHWDGREREILLIEIDADSAINEGMRESIEDQKDKLREWVHLEEMRSRAQETEG
ncbi:MAG: hypothetical protein K9K67_16100, partial [Bacteriovoracaceae bacterium]|nr:hypothetical protein [Bacteriovoracaceae bacterium]